MGHQIHSRRLHLISWERICSPKQVGGLGLSSLVQKKEAFLSKMAAQLVLNPNSLWAKMVASKYNLLGNWYNYFKPPHCSTIWSRIIKQGAKIQHCFMWTIGTGADINVMYDPWFSCVPLSKTPPFLNMNITFDR